MSNYLKNETSPYLLQHAQNPVDWYPWCSEAFERAKNEDKPVFLSIGYSTCHWCHVMAHESFENKETAQILNRDFISIKVDREERPDIDSVYMSVCQAFTGSGGWPMSIFMTWDKKPFYAGTYFPPQPHYGMPGFNTLLGIVADRWKNNRGELLHSASQIISHIKEERNRRVDVGNMDLKEDAIKLFEKSFDRKNGGFGGAPKFPSAHNLLFLILYAKQKDSETAFGMAGKTLLMMRKGGIFDHVGYGFSRYSTDERFLVPHFEKMLYDNALLIMAYLAAFCATGNKFFLDTAEKTAGYILREMVSADGGFYSAQDADSEGMEGRFYTFTLDEITSVLGAGTGKQFAEAFGVTLHGNFEGTNILNLLDNNNPGAENSSYFREELEKLYSYRKSRTKLHLDDKCLASWNSFMIAALSMLYRVSHKEKYLAAAQKAQIFIENNMCSIDGNNNPQIYASCRNGKCSGKGFLDDYAFYAMALAELYNSTLDSVYLRKAGYFLDEAVRRFGDNGNGGYFLDEAGNNELFVNPKETYDGAMPCGNSIMAYNFVRLYQLSGDERYNTLALNQLSFMEQKSQDYPAGHCMFLISKMLYENPPVHITVVLENNSGIKEIKDNLPFLANITIAPESSGYPLLNGKTTYYVCRGYSCMPPSNKIEF